jgi:hypothetical protein
MLASTLGVAQMCIKAGFGANLVSMPRIEEPCATSCIAESHAHGAAGIDVWPHMLCFRMG